MRKITASVLASLAVAGAAAALVPAAASATDGYRCGQNDDGGRAVVVGLTADATLVCFREHRPGKLRTIGRISGLEGDARLVGIDHRPATGELYGLGDAGGVYVLDTTNGAATKKAQITVALQGTAFGVDFNPSVDRLRVVSDTGQNLRVNVVDGVTASDAALNTGPGTTSLGITGAAYTNNDADPTTATTLFDLDTANDQIAVQAPPNNGSLSPTGKLGADVTGDVGFDILSVRRNGTTVANRAFAAVTTADGRSSFHSIDVLTGRATARGWFPTTVTDIALPLG